MVENDESLMAAYQRGNYDAFHSLYAKYSKKVYGYLRKKVGKPEIVDELFQKVFMKLHETREKYDPKYPFAPWLFMISRQTYIDEIRKFHSTVPIEDHHLVTDPITEATEIKWEGLPTSEREVLQKKYFENLDYDEMAKHLGVNPQAARKRVSRAIAKLRKLMGAS